MKRRVVIATISWARNKKEEKIILKTLAELNKLGLPIILTDESRSKLPIFEKVKKLSNIRVLRAAGLDAKIKKSLSEASHMGEFIFFTESDKLEFVHDFGKLFVEKFLNHPRGSLLPTRLPKNFKRLPAYQKAMEDFISNSFGALTNIWIEDISYGPRIFPSFLVKYLLETKSPVGWGWITYLMVINYRLHLPLRVIKLNTSSPIDVQKNKELAIFRMQQLIDLIHGMQLGWKIRL